MTAVTELTEWLRVQLDADEWWAREASRRDEDYTPTGEHWQWEDGETDEVLTIDPTVGDELQRADGEWARAALRSVELYPTNSVGPLPHFAIPSCDDPVEPAVAGHIIRHDPARVLAEIESKRLLLADIERDLADDPTDESAIWRARVLALPFAARPGYQEGWRQLGPLTARAIGVARNSVYDAQFDWRWGVARPPGPPDRTTPRTSGERHA